MKYKTLLYKIAIIAEDEVLLNQSVEEVTNLLAKVEDHLDICKQNYENDALTIGSSVQINPMRDFETEYETLVEFINFVKS